jgi:hypothetical protein
VGERKLERKAGEGILDHLPELFIVGEVKKDKVTGFHNWIRFYLQEKEGLVDYYSHNYDGPVSIWKNLACVSFPVFQTLRFASHPKLIDSLMGIVNMAFSIAGGGVSQPENGIPFQCTSITAGNRQQRALCLGSRQRSEKENQRYKTSPCLDILRM